MHSLLLYTKEIPAVKPFRKNVPRGRGSPHGGFASCWRKPLHRGIFRKTPVRPQLRNGMSADSARGTTSQRLNSFAPTAGWRMPTEAQRGAPCRGEFPAAVSRRSRIRVLPRGESVSETSRLSGCSRIRRGGCGRVVNVQRGHASSRKSVPVRRRMARSMESRELPQSAPSLALR